MTQRRGAIGKVIEDGHVTRMGRGVCSCFASTEVQCVGNGHSETSFGATARRAALVTGHSLFVQQRKWASDAKKTLLLCLFDPPELGLSTTQMPTDV